MHLAPNADEDLVVAPHVVRLGPAPLQRIGKQPAEAQGLLADTLAGHDHAAGSQNGLDLAQAQAAAVIQLDRMLDRLGREAEAAVGIGGRCHDRHCAIARPDLPT